MICHSLPFQYDLLVCANFARLNAFLPQVNQPTDSAPSATASKSVVVTNSLI